ncbi:hypothetical protein QQP08_005886 [Theobroma cacao]|nr:hypothetical protein QQP08_005886 [Theobroma cacao]
MSNLEQRIIPSIEKSIEYGRKVTEGFAMAKNHCCKLNFIGHVNVRAQSSVIFIIGIAWDHHAVKIAKTTLINMKAMEVSK